MSTRGSAEMTAAMRYCVSTTQGTDSAGSLRQLRIYQRVFTLSIRLSNRLVLLLIVFYLLTYNLLHYKTMTLKEFEDYLLQFPPEHKFERGISYPFSWRGIYAEVAFEIINETMTVCEIINRIKTAKLGSYTGWKGGEYSYDDNTPIHFETDTSSYSDERYARQVIQQIEGLSPYKDIEEHLVNVAFK